MKIAVIGTGNVGSGLAKRWAKSHEVMFGSRDPEKAKEKAKALGVQAGSFSDAAQFGEVIVLAVPYTAAADCLKQCGSLDGKVLIDCTNPLNANMGLAIGFSTSAAEEIAKAAQGAKVVKGFNTIFAQIHQAHSQSFNDLKPSVFYCGNDEAAKKTVAHLIQDAGYEAVDSGPLINARYLEPMAGMMIQFGYGLGMGPNVAYKLLRK